MALKYLKAKYRFERRPVNYLGSSKELTTLFNKFVRTGKTEFSHDLITRSIALIVKQEYRRISPMFLVTEKLKDLIAPIGLSVRPKAKELLTVPHAVLRFKHINTAIQLVVIDLKKNKTRFYSEQINNLFSIFLKQTEDSSAYVELSRRLALSYEERANEELW
jgi:hypothetical protein